MEKEKLRKTNLDNKKPKKKSNIDAFINLTKKVSPQVSNLKKVNDLKTKKNNFNNKKTKNKSSISNEKVIDTKEKDVKRTFVEDKKSKNKLNIKAKKSINKKIILFITFVLIVFLGCVIFYNYQQNLVPERVKVFINDDNRLEINFKVNKFKLNKDVYCLLSYDEKKLNDNWIKSENNKCIFDIENREYYVYLKTNNNTPIKLNNNEGVIKKFSFDKDNIYLAINGSEKLNYNLEAYGNTTSMNLKYKISDENVVEIKDNVVYGKNVGKTTVIGYYDEKVFDEINVIVTNLIVSKPTTFDFRKPYVNCNMYLEEEANLLDTILFDRVDTAGRGTRAGVLAAVRFLMLEWPKRISYFSENGRMNNFSGPRVDGEGRYYHLGLYLSESKYEQLSQDNIMNGPGSWGCPIYSVPAEKVQKNGLDCSGFISWVLYNGGFDVKDVGAGPNSILSLISYGDLYNLTSEMLDTHKVKAGDILHQGIGDDTHIALIAGINGDTYYVAESLWGNPHFGPVIVEYSKDRLVRNFDRVILMENYYKDDGNYAEMW